jgi:hypothetical protein
LGRVDSPSPPDGAMLNGIFHMDMVTGVNFFYEIREIQPLTAFDRLTLANANCKLMVALQTCWAYNKEVRSRFD